MATTPQDTDRQALKAYLAGDRNAFGALYDRHAPALFSTILAVLKNEDWAAETLQEFFVQLATQADTFLHAESLPAYMFGAARKLALHTLRGRVRYQAALRKSGTAQVRLHPRSAAPSPTDNDTATALTHALQSLDEESRAVVTLHLYENLSFDEISAITDVARSTLHDKYKAALATLRTALKTLE